MSTFEGADQAAKAELLDLLLDATQDGIVDLNLQTGETMYNRRWKHLLGFDSAELAEYHETPDSWRDLIHPDDRGQALRLIDEHLEQGWPLYTTVRMRHRHNSYKHILVRGGSHRDVEGCAVRLVLVFSDIDERIRYEQEQRAQLVWAHKMGAMAQLAAGVAREIDAPLQLVGDDLHFAKTAVDDLLRLVVMLRSALHGAAHAPASAEQLSELARVEVELNFESAREALPTAIERSLQGVERATKTLRAMRSFARPDNGEELSPTDLKALLESTVMMTTNEWKYVADVELGVAPGLPPVPCMSGELTQVVLDLIVNASHAIADVVGSSGNKGKISISAHTDGTHAVIHVADTGTGIPHHARAQVFEPFFTTKEPGKGTGQGLAMAYNTIVDRHKGRIEFETELGVGTTFIVRLPLRTASPGPSAVTT